MREHDALYQVSSPLWRNVWPGRGAIVLPGATIDDNTIVAAGPVMFDDILADGFWRGNPATFVKPVRASDKFVRP
ncbi:acyltransferase [Novosphingobium sp.]|uniref:acyltransferase n=1 Tax=Novosphingobium sp. TaxID=1874826 RepID=UPI0038B94A6A